VAADLIAKQGGSVALPKFAVPSMGWQGYFLDTEGNTFGVFEPDASAS
jgi:predicted enzyme related to lactoylglutathione lyase